MSEYQYYEFQALDRPLSAQDRQALRQISSRARITPTSFTNSYQWGDLKADSLDLMRRYFDVHLYVASWFSPRLMLRLPARLVDRAVLDAALNVVESVALHEAGDNVILAIGRDDEGYDADDAPDGSGWLAALTPLRAALLGGDTRPLYLLWLMAVEEETVADDAPEPFAGLGPLTGSLDALAEFLRIDKDLVAAAAERVAEADAPAEAARALLAAMPEQAKTDLLVRLAEGDTLVGAELRAAVRRHAAPTATVRRTVAELRDRAEAVRQAREQAEAAAAAAKQRRAAAEAAKAQRARLAALARRGDSVWDEVEAEIEKRNATAYDAATALLVDLHALADEQGKTLEYARRIGEIRTRHATKRRMVERLEGL